jgi:hypothetical protein
MHDFSHRLAELDDAVMRIGQSRAHVVAQEKRVALSKRSGADTRQSQNLLATFRDCLRLHQTYYDMRATIMERR